MSDAEMFAMMTSGMTPDKTRVFFGDLDFTKFKCFKNEDGDFYMKSEEQGVVIDKLIHHKIFDFLCKLHSIKKKPEFAGTKGTKRILIDEDREKRKRHKSEDFHSQMLPLISSMVNSPGFKNSINEVRDLQISAFMDSVMRIQTIKSAEHLTNAYYSGNINTDKFDTRKLNWMSELNK